ncbi:methyltransferase MtaA/CmuA family [Treponema primitia ZAS-2]|uniref:Methyltransferase MtaA/CmuA family n=1 Tax=Treponema primitia (strain ATCC BAA-887 / DSM 12427 / ZAS-2) TaxID=545694 RepID=F5YJD6_TREPZ|nr:methylcobamide--CoM methyltransferase [Treponema primitia]AEF86154.1 methyltransferase MtaA/CmuA family [Treponema primitia ZAS-2]
MADVFSPKERLIRTLEKKETERPPVICPGGMMNSAIVEVMNVTGHTLPAAHHDWNLMSALAEDVHRLTGFENIGAPFCLTVEAEALGSEINYGTLGCEPKIAKEAFPSVEAVQFLPPGTMEKNKRVGTVVQSIAELSKKNPDIPVIGSLTGPLSAAASLVDPMTFLKQLRKNPADAHRLVAYVCAHLIEYAGLMVENGVSIITIADPTATGEILGPRFFKEYALFYLNTLADAIRALGVPVIIHICGDLGAVKPYLGELRGDALSVDAMVNLSALKQENSGLIAMGNISTYLLESGAEEVIAKSTRYLVEQGIDIIAPACGLSTSTPLGNIQALTRAVTEGK